MRILRQEIEENKANILLVMKIINLNVENVTIQVTRTLGLLTIIEKYINTNLNRNMTKFFHLEYYILLLA